MKLQFESYEEGFGGELKCPSCGFNYLHHDKVEIFERGEDEEKGLHVKVENGVATIDTNLSGNPSARRHGLTIQFWCEGCKAKPVLSISQHKGNTWIDFNWLRVKKHNKAVNRRQQSWLGLLARAMGHRKVYPVDWNKMPPVDLVTIDYESFAEDNNQKALLEEAYCIVK